MRPIHGLWLAAPPKLISLRFSLSPWLPFWGSRGSLALFLSMSDSLSSSSPSGVLSWTNGSCSILDGSVSCLLFSVCSVCPPPGLPGPPGVPWGAAGVSAGGCGVASARPEARWHRRITCFCCSAKDCLVHPQCTHRMSHPFLFHHYHHHHY